MTLVLRDVMIRWIRKFEGPNNNVKGAVAQLPTCESGGGKTYYADLKRAQSFGDTLAGDGR